MFDKSGIAIFQICRDCHIWIIELIIPSNSHTQTVQIFIAKQKSRENDNGSMKISFDWDTFQIIFLMFRNFRMSKLAFELCVRNFRSLVSGPFGLYLYCSQKSRYFMLGQIIKISPICFGFGRLRLFMISTNSSSDLVSLGFRAFSSATWKYIYFKFLLKNTFHLQ